MELLYAATSFTNLFLNTSLKVLNPRFYEKDALSSQEWNLNGYAAKNMNISIIIIFIYLLTGELKIAKLKFGN